MSEQFCAVSPDGDRLIVVLPDESGVPREMTLSFHEARTLAMTLPGLLNVAFGQRFRDANLRHVYPVEKYSLECASDREHVLLTLSASGSLNIAFSLNTEMTFSLARDLSDDGALLEMAPRATTKLPRAVQHPAR